MNTHNLKLKMNEADLLNFDGIKELQNSLNVAGGPCKVLKRLYPGSLTIGGLF